MSYRLKNNNRPDKLLQQKLGWLAFFIVLSTLLMFIMLVFPKYLLLEIALATATVMLSLFFIAQVLYAAEDAINYGGFANEILNNDRKIKRVDNATGMMILQNKKAETFFENKKVITFIEKNMQQNQNNQSALHRLKTAIKTKICEQVVMEFENGEWYEIILRPLALTQNDLIEIPFISKPILKHQYFLWSALNITSQKNMEKIFKDEREETNNFLDHLPIAVYKTNSDFKIEYINSQFCKLFGEKKQKLINKDIRSLLANNSFLPDDDKFEQECFFVNAEEKVFSSYVIAEEYFHNNKKKKRGVIISVPDAKIKFSEELLNAKEKIYSLFWQSPIAIIRTDTKGFVTELNKSAVDLLQTDNHVNKNVSEFFEQASAEKIMSEIKLFQNNIKKTAYFESILANQKSVAVQMNMCQKEHAPTENDFCGIDIYITDETKQKSLEQQFAQAQKMQALGQMAGGIAHDFNNLLTAMIGFCDLLLQRHGIGDPSFADLLQIKQNANRAASLVRHLLAFSRKQPLKPKLMDITENFADFAQMIKRILGEKIDLNIHHEKDLGYVRVDPVQFNQVILNLAINAKDAMENKGKLEISTRVEELMETYQYGADKILPGKFVVVDVTDNGCGIAPENIDRIFDPFFSTKQNVVGSGTGLGLAMVYGIVRQTEGFIKVKSQLGQGTTFSIYLPRFDADETINIQENKKEQLAEEKQIVQVEEKISAPMNMSEKYILGLNLSGIDNEPLAKAKDLKILFVEDEDAVRAVSTRSLTKKGYNVTACNCAETALEVLETNKDFDLLITDMIMPGMNGADLAKNVKEMLPNIKIILASGYSEEIARSELSDDDDFEFIAKPFSLAVLNQKILEVMNGK